MEFWNNTYHFEGATTINGVELNSPSVTVKFCTVFEQGRKATLDLSIREQGALQPRFDSVDFDCTPQADITADFENWLTANVGAWTKTTA